MKREFYEKPHVEVVEIEFEGTILSASGGTPSSSTNTELGLDSIFDGGSI